MAKVEPATSRLQVQ